MIIHRPEKHVEQEGPIARPEGLHSMSKYSMSAKLEYMIQWLTDHSCVGLAPWCILIR